jgi:hypothetical protein
VLIIDAAAAMIIAPVECVRPFPSCQFDGWLQEALVESTAIQRRARLAAWSHAPGAGGRAAFCTEPEPYGDDRGDLRAFDVVDAAAV